MSFISIKVKQLHKSSTLPVKVACQKDIMTDAIKYPKSSEEALQEYLSCWNWGAFLLTWIWAPANRVPFDCLLFMMFPPVEAFMMGKYGNKLAWNNGWWRDLEHFKRTQRRWASAGIAFYLGISVTLIAVIIILN